MKTFLAKKFLGRTTAAVAIAALLAIGVAACTPPDTSSAPPSDPYTNEIYQALNRDRASVGLPPLTWSPKLASNANTWAAQMSADNSLHHQNLSMLLGSPIYAPYRTLGENIIVGPGTMTGTGLEAAWRASPPHWANISSGAFNVVGIGYFRGPDGRMWAVQEFGGL